MNAEIEKPDYCQMASDKYSEISKMIFSENVNKVALADAIIAYGSLQYKSGFKDGFRG
jgi:hypothetical protein